MDLVSKRFFLPPALASPRFTDIFGLLNLEFDFYFRYVLCVHLIPVRFFFPRESMKTREILFPISSKMTFSVQFFLSLLFLPAQCPTKKSRFQNRERGQGPRFGAISLFPSARIFQSDNFVTYYFVLTWGSSSGLEL